MCGICGYVGFSGGEGLIARMTEAITHRGPDDVGHFVDEKMGLGVRRLSIIDVEGGHQPITNDDGSLVIVYNGEIYNYLELKEELLSLGHRFRTNSDTEILLHLYEEMGAECLSRLRGMFAFAIFDVREKTLFVARDRLGIKPLYVWQKNGGVVFASEIKSILEYDQVNREPHLPAIDAYLGLRYVPGPATMFRNIEKLPPGHWMKWKDGKVSIKRYWNAEIYNGSYGKDEEYIEGFTELFKESVSLRLMSDVPLGAYLSGGVDSNSIVATMASCTTQPVKTFSVGFDWEKDELHNAAESAKILGCDHNEIICRPEDMALLPDIVRHSDQPLGDAIVVPTYLLAQAASKSVKVVLTGDGADEMLAGYAFHKVINMGHHYKRSMPSWFHEKIVEPMARGTPVGILDHFFDYPASLGEEGKRKVLTYLRNLRSGSVDSHYRHLISLFDETDKKELYSRDFGGAIGHDDAGGGGEEEGAFLDRLLYSQFRDWLPDNILARQDKMSMAHGLEARVPFLDHKLVEFLQTVPPHLKLNRLFGDKRLLREYAGLVLPKGNAQRRKTAFYIPVERYLDQPAFRDLVMMTLDSERVRRRGYFDPMQVKRLIEGTDRREFLDVKKIIALVMLELWHMIFIDRTV